MFLISFTLTNIYDCIKDIIIPLIGSIGGFCSFYIAYKVYFKEYKPKILLDYEVVNDGMFNSLIVREYISEDERFGSEPGFNRSRQDTYNIYLKIKNNSNQAITDFELEYELNLFKWKLKIDENDPSEFEEDGVEHFRTVSQKINIDYIPPQKEISKLIFISSIIPVADVNIVQSKSKEVKFFTKKFTLYKFNIVEELDGMNDSVHRRNIYGII